LEHSVRTAAYLDPKGSLDVRVDDLLARMTLPEKVGQLLQLDARGDLLDIVSAKLAGSILHASPERMHEAIALARQTRLGIPLLTADDCIHGHSFWPGATIFPTQLAMACTWTPRCLSEPPGPPPPRSPRPASTGRSPRCCASPATCAGAG